MSKSPLRLLHIEDDDGDAKIVQRAFDKEFACESYTIERVVSIDEAMKKLKEIIFDVILLDLNLNGVQDLDNLRVIKEEYPDLPIVVLSGHDSTEMALNVVRHGAQEYLVKGLSNSRVLGLAIRLSIERKTYERLLFKQANFDLLTGLPNRHMFLESLKQSLTRSDRWEKSAAIMFLDVNGFKKVNDTLGHDIGDVLLQQIAARLKLGLRASDMVARYAGDEFVVYIDAEIHASKEICIEVARKIISLFHEPIIIAGHEIKTGVTIGIALYPNHGKDSDELIRNADLAMYKARESKNNFCFAK